MTLTPGRKGSISLALVAVVFLLIRWVAAGGLSETSRGTSVVIGVLVLGACLAAFGFAVAAIRERSSTWTAWVALVLAVSIVGVGGFGVLRHASASRVAPTPYVSLEGGFSATFPTPPAQHQQPYVDAAGASRVMRVWASTISPTDGFAVFVADDTVVPGESTAQRYDRYQALSLEQSKATLLAQHDVTVDGLAGREVEVNVAPPASAAAGTGATFVRMRWFVSGPRIYQVMRTLEARRADPGGEAFLESFRVLAPTR